MRDNNLNEKKSNEAKRTMMLEGKISKVVSSLALPLIISMLIDSFYNLADTYFVSWLGTAATAAVGINSSLMNFIRSIAMGFGIGSSSYISILLGQKNDRRAEQTAATALFTSMGFMAVFAVFAFIFMKPLVILLGATDAEVFPYSMQYASYILLSAPITAGTVCLSHSLRAEGGARYSMFGTLSGCIINIALDPLFIHTLGMGVAGAALATCLSKVISFCVLLIPYIRRRTMINLSIKNFTPSFDIYLNISRMGLPAFLRLGVMSLTNVLTNKMASDYGPSVLAAVSVCNKIMHMVASAIGGFSQGFQPVAGFCWGSKKYGRVREAFRFTVVTGMIISVFLGIGLYFTAPYMISAFTETDTVIMQLGAFMVRTQCFTLPIHMFVLILNGLYQALGKAVGATVLGLARRTLCFIPSLIILTSMFGSSGIAMTDAASDVVSIFLAVPMLLLILRDLNKREEENLQRQTESEELILTAAEGKN